MRILGVFSAFDLAAVSSEDRPVSQAEAKDYVHWLYKAGYLSMARKHSNKTVARYRLRPTRITGPKPPMIQRGKQVYDPNLKRVVWPVEEASGGSEFRPSESAARPRFRPKPAPARRSDETGEGANHDG
jgi:hypothetical protein